MRPRGNTQRLYNEAIQILSGTRVKKQTITSDLNNTDESNNNSMAVKRRQACTQTVLHLWDAIAYIRQQKQIPNFDRLSAYIKRVYNMSPADLEKQLKFAVSDGLIYVKKSVGCKGSKVGLEQDAYRIPEDLGEKDSHDWYCFTCHMGGEVIKCSTCHRVFHEACLTSETTKPSKFICPACKNHEKFALNVKKNELNTLLGYTCVRLKEKTRELHRIPHPDDEKWRFNFLIYEPMDLIAIEEKMKSNEYFKLADFYTDAQQIVHNVVVYFGMYSRISDMAHQMLQDCEYDLMEIIQCANCYKMSNTKTDNSWFCQPCSPPHELVYAKVKGYPYWPAKVIKKTDNTYDVRFFGAFHQRSLIQQDYIKPVSTPYKKLGIKYTPSFDRAFKELSLHQELVAKKSSVSKENSEPNEEESKSQINNNATVNATTKLKATPLRKRKSTSTPLTKPPSAKRTATVPVKKNKKFYQESPTSSSPKNTSEDVSEDHNLVSSSQDTSVFHVSVSVQTSNELLPTENDSAEKNNNESKDSKEVICNCGDKYEKLMKELQAKLETEHKEEKTKALKELTDKFQSEMEAEKKKTLSASIEKVEQEGKEAQTKAIEQLKLAHTEEMCKLIERHNVEISETKKKQWCYNCEAEAIYHCCWNTSYCSVECQQVHWHKEHKRTCRRKR